MTPSAHLEKQEANSGSEIDHGLALTVLILYEIRVNHPPGGVIHHAVFDGLPRQANGMPPQIKISEDQGRKKTDNSQDSLVIPDPTTEIGRFSAYLEGSGRGHKWFIGVTTLLICAGSTYPPWCHVHVRLPTHSPFHRKPFSRQTVLELILEKSTDSEEGQDRGASNLGDSNDRGHGGQVVGGADSSLRKGIVNSHGE